MVPAPEILHLLVEMKHRERDKVPLSFFLLGVPRAKRHPQATWHRAQTVRQGLMRARRLSQFVILFLSGLPLLTNAQQRSADTNKVVALEKKWTEAYKQRDVGILSSLLAEEFVITVEDGSTYGKLGYISHSADSSVRVEVAQLSDLRVRVHGNVAVVTGAYHESGTSKGKPYEYRDRLTDVWVKSPAGWQVIASHYSVPLTPDKN
jgi:ketosteroid isomerase-like protein